MDIATGLILYFIVVVLVAIVLLGYAMRDVYLEASDRRGGVHRARRMRNVPA